MRLANRPRSGAMVRHRLARAMRYILRLLAEPAIQEPETAAAAAAILTHAMVQLEDLLVIHRAQAGLIAELLISLRDKVEPLRTHAEQLMGVVEVDGNVSVND